MKRRNFIQKTALGSLMLGAGAFPMNAMTTNQVMKITILHTNDVHSRIEPFSSGRNAGLGGAARRAALIAQVRREEKNVLLFDAGDIFQGTPYFNFFDGELEFKLMSNMKYDAATLGNHDFDAGIDGLHKQLPLADFPFLVSNYDFSDTIMNGKTKAYKIFNVGNLRIGVFGLGIELDSLVPKSLYKETRYLDPIANANKYAGVLKHDEKCDYVICLSHLGYKYKEDKVSDVVIAERSESIDLIIGGHTHTSMEKPDVILNKKGKEVLINQVGWAGMMLGRLDVYFEQNTKKQCTTCKNILVKGA